MTGHLIIHEAGPLLSVQDLGRPGFLAYGLTPGGAADRQALYEGAALLRQDPACAAIEMTGMGGRFQATRDMVIALTGAPMSAQLDGNTLLWNASHTLPAGAQLSIGGAQKGTYGYLHVAGGIAVPAQMGARSAHVSAGIGAALKAGQRLPITDTALPQAGWKITPADRFSGGVLRIIRSMQTAQFSGKTLERFVQTDFVKDARANRMAIRIEQSGDGFFAQNGLGIVSEVIVCGDVQIAGDGAPFVLMSECQTTGGYPRIGTVLPHDLPRIAQAQTGTRFSFEFVSLEQAIEIEAKARAEERNLPARLQPLVRDPRDIADLLSYQLVSGAVDAHANPFTPKGEQS